MKETIDSADIYKCTVIGKSHYSTFDHVANMDCVPDLRNLSALLFIKVNLMGEYSLISSLINSGYFDSQGLADEFVSLLYISVI